MRIWYLPSRRTRRGICHARACHAILLGLRGRTARTHISNVQIATQTQNTCINSLNMSMVPIQLWAAACPKMATVVL